MPITLRRSLLTAIPAVILLAHPATAHAQAGPRWQAWIGCWTAVTPPNAGSAASAPSPMLCVTPTPDADVVQIVAISDGKIVSQDRLDASGRSQNIDAGGCTGSTRASWSEDRRRVFLRSSVTCEGQPSETSAILAMANSGGGEWLDVRSVTAGGNSEVRVARYRDAGVPGSVPAEIASALRDRNMSVRAARIAATAPVNARDIIEASHAADPAIVEAWLMENGQQYSADAATLQQLSDAGVPGRVTDALVSAARAREGDRYASADDRPVAVYDPWAYGVRYRVQPYPVVRYRPVYSYAPVGFSFSLFGFGYAPYGYAYTPFGYYPYGYRSYAYVPFGFGYNVGRVYRPPVVVVHTGYPRSPEPPRTAHPRAVREQGYTQSYSRDYPQLAPQRRSEPRREVSNGNVVQRSAEPVRQEPVRQERRSSDDSHRSSGSRSAHGRP